MAYIRITKDLLRDSIKYCYNLWHNKKKSDVSLLTDVELEEMITQVYCKGNEDSTCYISSLNLNKMFLEYIKTENIGWSCSNTSDSTKLKDIGVRISPVILRVLLKQYLKEYKNESGIKSSKNIPNVDLIVLEILSINEKEQNFILNKDFTKSICKKYMNLGLEVNLYNERCN